MRSLLTPAVLCVTGWCVLQEEEDEEEGKDSAKRREAWRLEEAAEGESDWLSSSNFHGSFDAESDDDEDAEDEDDDVGSTAAVGAPASTAAVEAVVSCCTFKWSTRPTRR